MCFLQGRRVAALSALHDPSPGASGTSTSRPTTATGRPRGRRRPAATLLMEPMDVMDQGRMALVRDPVGAQFGLWQGPARTPARRWSTSPARWCATTSSPPDPEPARAFYAAVFDFTLDRNQDLPDFDFTFLRRPDGHEVGGIMGTARRARRRGRRRSRSRARTRPCAARSTRAAPAPAAREDFVYGRMATITDPFGAEFTVITRPET